jgi:hypothetical protein
MGNNVQFTRSFNSFSGVDMNVVMGNEIMCEIQGLSYTQTREKGPIYTMGSADPRSFSRGKRGIAGSMVLVQGDRSPLISVLGIQERMAYVGNEYEVDPKRVIRKIGDVETSQFATAGGVTGTFGVSNGRNLVTADKVLARPQYPDQIMPFQVSITAANEYGHVAQMHILGVEIMNCGMGLSIDDMTMDESCTFVCTSILPWSNQAFIRDRVVQDVSGSINNGRSGGGPK